MKPMKRLWNLIPAMILWAMVSVFLWGWIFTFLTDTKPENKLTLFIDAAVTDGTGLAVQLEEPLLDDTISMVKVHPFTYAMLDSEPLRQSDAYIVRASHVEEYRDWFAPLPESLTTGSPEASLEAQPATSPDLLVLDGVPYGIRVYHAATGTGIAQAFLPYQDPALPDEDYYLMLGKASLHLTANPGGLDDRAILLAEAFLNLP
ncbi:MAG: hypothetical protein E7323_02505 [Clostridiales bacterium]|nr:hypothetical protein [Clostridiales bacterium]